jgi:hypothetical protein
MVSVVGTTLFTKPSSRTKAVHPEDLVPLDAFSDMTGAAVSPGKTNPTVIIP